MTRFAIFDPGDRPSVGEEHIEIESCHSTWIFDVRHRRFRRVLKGLGTGPIRPTTAWRPYYLLERFNGCESFVVWLNPEGTRLLRSWHHEPGCTACTDHPTAEHPVTPPKDAA